MHTAENKTTNTAEVSNKNAGVKLPFFQPKLTINEPGDQYEQEADAMADKVMRMPSNSLSFGEGGGEVFFKPKPISVSHVQRKCANCEEEEKLQRKENSSQATEASSETSSYINSLSSKGSSLPESARSFFEPRFGYDFSDVKIHNDSEAAKSTDRINALAYTSGNNIVFNQNQFSPESGSGKKLLAHELTHTIQQNTNSVNSLQRSPDESARIAKRKGPITSKDVAKDNPIDPTDAYNTISALDDILTYNRQDAITNAPERFQPSLMTIWKVNLLMIHGVTDDPKLNPDLRGLFEDSYKEISLAITSLQKDPDNKDWAVYAVYVEGQIKLLQNEVLVDEAAERVKNSEIIDKKIIEFPDDSHPKDQAELLHTQLLPKLAETIKDINEQATRLGDTMKESVKEDVETMEGNIPSDEIEEIEKYYKGSIHEDSFAQLERLQGLLFAADGYLQLTDDEFQKKIQNIQSVFTGVSTVAELVKSAIELAGGVVALTSAFAYSIAKLAGDANMASEALEVATLPIKFIGKAVSGIEIVHGIFTLIDPNSTSDEKLDGAVEIASGGAYLAGSVPLSLSITMTAILAKYEAKLLWGIISGLNTEWFNETFTEMLQIAGEIASQESELERARMLELSEKNQDKSAALSEYQENEKVELIYTINSFLDECQPTPITSGLQPGSWSILVGLFAPLMKLHNAKTVSEVKTAAKIVVNTILWCVYHAKEIIDATSQHEDLGAAEILELGVTNGLIELGTIDN